MDEMSSAKFRTGYAKLTRPTVVTVNGHVIGVWMPGSATPTPPTPGALRHGDATFNSRPFTPVPKRK